MQRLNVQILNVTNRISEVHMADALVLGECEDDMNAVVFRDRALSLLPSSHSRKSINPRSVLEQLLQSTNS